MEKLTLKQIRPETITGLYLSYITMKTKRLDSAVRYLFNILESSLCVDCKKYGVRRVLVLLKKTTASGKFLSILTKYQQKSE